MADIDDILDGALGSVHPELVLPRGATGTPVTPAFPVSQGITSAQGYNYQAAQDALDAEDAQYRPELPQNMSLEDLAAFARGISDYQESNQAMAYANAIDRGRTAIAGAIQGAGSTALGAMLAPTSMLLDAGTSLYNTVANYTDLPYLEADLATTLMDESNKSLRAFTDIFRTDEELKEREASNARRAIRENVNSLKYQEALDRGDGFLSATANYLGRDALIGLDNATDTLTTMLDASSQVAGQVLAGRAFAKGAANIFNNVFSKRALSEIGHNAIKHLAKGKVLSKEELNDVLTNRLFLANMIGTEAVSNVGQAVQKIDSMSDTQLYNQSPFYRYQLNSYIAQGYSEERAAELARADLRARAGRLEFFTGAAGAALGGSVAYGNYAPGGLSSNILGSGNPVSRIISDTLGETTEEGITGFVQQVGSNYATQQTSDPNQYLLENAAANAVESAIAGGLGGGHMAALNEVGRGANYVLSGQMSQDITKAYEKSQQERRQNLLQDALQAGANTNNATGLTASNNQETPEGTSTPEQAATANTASTTNVGATPTDNVSAENKAKEQAQEELKKKTGLPKHTVIVDPETNENIIRIDEGNLKGSIESVSPEEIKLYDLGKYAEEAKKHNMDLSYSFSLGNIAGEFLDAKTNKDKLKYAARFKHLRENYLDRLSRYNQVISDINEVENINYSPTVRKYLQNLENSLKGNNTFTEETPKDAQMKGVMDFINNAASQIDSFIKTNTGAKFEEISKDPVLFELFLEELLDENLNPNDPAVKETISKFSSSEQFKEKEKLLKNVLNLIKEKAKTGNRFINDPNVYFVNQNVQGDIKIDEDKFTTSELINNLTKGLIRKNVGQTRFNLQRLYDLASTRINKVNAINEGLKKNSNKSNEFVSVNPHTSEYYINEVNYGDPNLYDSLYEEQDQLVDTFNNVLDILSSIVPNLAGKYKPLTKVDRLPNEAELKKAFKRKYSRRGKSVTSATEDINALQGNQEEELDEWFNDSEEVSEEETNTSPKEEVLEPESKVQEPTEQPQETQEPVAEEATASNQESTEQESTQQPLAEAAQKEEITPKAKEETTPKTEEEVRKEKFNEAVEKVKTEKFLFLDQTAEEEELDDWFKTPGDTIEVENTQQKKEEKKESTPTKDSAPKEEVWEPSPELKSIPEEQLAIQDVKNTNLSDTESLKLMEEIDQEYDPSITEAEISEWEAQFNRDNNLESVEEETEQADPNEVPIKEETTILSEYEEKAKAAKKAIEEGLKVFNESKGTSLQESDLIRTIESTGQSAEEVNNILNIGLVQYNDYTHLNNIFPVKEKNVNKNPTANLTLREEQYVARSGITQGEEVSDVAHQRRFNTFASIFSRNLFVKKKTKNPYDDYSSLGCYIGVRTTIDKNSSENKKANKKDLKLFKAFSSEFSNFVNYNNLNNSELKDNPTNNTLKRLKQNKLVSQIIFGRDANPANAANFDEYGNLISPRSHTPSYVNSDHLYLGVTNFNEKGQLEINKKVGFMLGMGTLQAAQDFDTRSRAKSEEDIQEEVANLGIVLKNTLNLSETDKTAMRYGSSISSFTASIANRTMDYLGIDSDNFNSISTNGRALMNTLATFGTKFLLKKGYLVQHTIHLVPLKNKQGEVTSHRAISEEDYNTLRNIFKRGKNLKERTVSVKEYLKLRNIVQPNTELSEQEKILIKDTDSKTGIAKKNYQWLLNSIDPNLVSLPYLVTNRVFFNTDTAKREHSIQFSGKNRGILDDLLAHSKERLEYYTPTQPDPATRPKLGTDASYTKKEIEALRVQQKIPYYLDEELLGVINSLYRENTNESTNEDSEEVSEGFVPTDDPFSDTQNRFRPNGLLAIANVNDDIDSKVFNDQSRESIKGKQLSITSAYDLINKRANKAKAVNPDLPRMYFDYNIHSAGRVQELSPHGPQSSKLTRAVFSNIRVEMNPTDPGHTVRFARAFLQAFGIKVKRLTDDKVTELFNKVLKAKYVYPHSVEELDSKTVLELFKNISETINGSVDNPFLALSALLNLNRYMSAVNTTVTMGEPTLFTNTISLELDGSCNGIANSRLKLSIDRKVPEKDMEALYNSNLYFGRDDFDVPTVTNDYEYTRDNYTGAAEKDQGFITNDTKSLYQDKEALIKDIEQGNTDNLPENAFKKNIIRWRSAKRRNAKNSDKIFLSDIQNAVLRVISFFFEDAAKFNENALTDSNNNESVISISRNSVKFPVVRTTYMEGRDAATKDLINADLSVSFSNKLSKLYQAPEKYEDKRGIYHVLSDGERFFWDEIQSGKMTNEQAKESWNEFLDDWELVNNYSINASPYEDAIRALDYNAESNDNAPLEELAPNVLDYSVTLLGVPNNRGALVYRRADTIADSASGKHFILRDPSTYTDAFYKNVQAFYVDPMYYSIVSDRSAGFTQVANMLVSTGNTNADFRKQLEKDFINSYVDTFGNLPSNNKLRQFRKSLSRMFPTQLTTGLGTIDAATTVREKNFGKENTEYYYKGPKTKSFTVEAEGNPFNGSSVLAQIDTNVEVNLSSSNRAAIVPGIVIMSGDGGMQSSRFSSETGETSTVNRYDGDDINPLDLEKESELLNKAAYDVIRYSFTRSWKENIKKTLKFLKQDKKLAVKYFDSLYANDKVFKSSVDLLKRQQRENPEGAPTILKGETAIRYLENQVLSTVEEIDKNNFLRSAGLLSMPIAMMHMSASEHGYIRRDPRDTFRVPVEANPLESAQISVRELNRRMDVIDRVGTKEYEHYLNTGEILVPAAVYENIPNYDEEKFQARRASKTLVHTDTNKTTKTIPNVGSVNREIAPNASLDVAPTRATTEVNLNATAVKNNGRIDLSFQQIVDNFFKNKDSELYDISKKFFNNFINNLDPNVSIKTIPLEEARKLDANLNSKNLAFYSETSKTIYVLEEAYNNAAKQKEVTEALIHELAHAIVNTNIHEIINNKKHPKYAYISELEKLYKRLRESSEQNAVEEFTVNNLLNNVIFNSGNNTNKREQRLKEFVAYMLTNPELMRFAQGQSVNKSSFFRRAFTKFIDLFKKIFGVNIKESTKAFSNVYGRTVLYTAVIANNDNVENSVANSVNEISKFTSTADDARLNRLSAKITDFANKAIAFRGNISMIDFVNHAARMDEILTELSFNSGLNLSKQQLTVASAVAMMFTTSLNTNSNIKIDAFNFRQQILNKLKPSDLTFATDTDPNQALARYESLLNLDKNEDVEGNNAALGVFMGLLSVEPRLRDAINKLNLKFNSKTLTTSVPVDLENSAVDSFLANFGEKALVELNSLLDKKTISKDKQAIDQLDSLVDSLLYLDRNTSILNKPSSLMSAGDEKISNYITSKGEKFLTSAFYKKLLQSDSNFAKYSAVALGLSVNTLLKDSSVVYQTNKKIIREQINKYNKTHPGFLSNFVVSAYRELMSADNTANEIYKAEKIAKASVQAIRTNWREIAPRQLKQMFAKEKVHLTDEQSAVLNKVILKTDLGALDNSLIEGIFTGKTTLEKEIKAREAKSTYLGKKFSKELAHYLNTNIASNGMLRNAMAIVKFSQTRESRSNDIKTIDELVTLYALKEQGKDAFNTAKDIYKNAPKAFNYTVNQQRQNKKSELEKLKKYPKLTYNVYKGYYPETNLTGANVKVVNNTDVSKYEALGYKVIGSTNGLESKYMQSSLNPLSTFDQGALQSVINQVGGVDTVFSWSSSEKVYKRIKSKPIVRALTMSFYGKGRPVKNNEAYIPVLDEDGATVIGYEITVNPKMYTGLTLEQDFANNLGNWKGRQIEEESATQLNLETIKTIKKQFEQASDEEKKKEFVDIVQLAKTNPIVKDALATLSEETRRAMGIRNNRGSFYVRVDLIPDVIGHREASVVDFVTGTSQWSPKTQKAVLKIVQDILGKRGFYYLYRAESATKSTISAARNFIVVRSLEVMAMNMASNVISLILRGVPIADVMKYTPRIVKELENYNHSRERQVVLEMEINGEMGKPVVNKIRLKRLQAQLEEEKALQNSFSFSKDLIEAGEYNTIADLGSTNDDILLSTGRWGEYIENKVNSLPDTLKEAGRQLIITKDTTLYRALEKGTKYGDFVAKAILYKHLTERKGLSKEEALNKVRYEYVNYDMLPGRSREYLENIGILWFYNYKLRIARTMVSMVKENPLHTLFVIAGISPLIDIGTPLSDNILSKFLTGGLENSIGFKIFENPFLYNHMWYNIFG